VAAEVFFENIHTQKRYKVVRFDAATSTMVLMGPLGREFDMPYSKESFERMGYRPVQAEAAATAPAPPPPVPQPASS
jgi:hypothetical protein